MANLQLPPELFEQIVGCANLRFDPSNSDRRLAVRVGLSAEVAVLPFRDKRPGTPFTVRLRDVSLTGVGFLHGKEMYAGEEFAIRLPRHQGKPLWVYCRVTRWQPLRSDLFIIGATYDRLLELKPEKPAAVLQAS